MRELRVTNRVTHKGQIADMWRRDVSKTSPMDPQTEFEVATRARAGDRKAREMLITANLRFVLSMAKNFSSDPSTLDDLIAVGNIGLTEAADKFDPTKGFKFISFAVWSIKKEMMQYMYEMTRTVKLPTSKAQLVGKIRKLEGEFIAIHGREPVLEEVIEMVNKLEGFKHIDVEYIQDIYRAEARTSSFNAPVTEDGSTLEEIYGNEDPAHTALVEDDTTLRIRGLLKYLTPDEKFIIERRFGLGRTEMELVDIAAEMKKNPETVRLHMRRALKKMKLGKRKLHSW